MAISTPRSPDSSVLDRSDAELVAELEEKATERWGDEWAISIRRWSDGSAQIYAEHIAGFTEDDYQKKERMMPAGNGEFGVDVVLIDQEEIVSHEVLEQPDGAEKNSE